ncbi:MAG TPA: DUF192 domain-containing protein [Candidatus Bilamarchaeaceae archaeon]|nr:DUF192 domain-containing protein [Candidatus Bilamarchaeaceae archaeon]
MAEFKVGKIPLAIIAAAVLLVIFFLLAQDSHPGKEQITIINSAGQPIHIYVEIADEWPEMKKRLMHREHLPEDEGMLFIFPQSGVYPFWMKNTLIPLDAIHISQDGTIVDILQMEPCTADPCPSYPPAAEALYILEVNKGFSERHGIEKGNRMLLPAPH